MAFIPSTKDQWVFCLILYKTHHHKCCNKQDEGFIFVLKHIDTSPIILYPMYPFRALYRLKTALKSIIET